MYWSDTGTVPSSPSGFRFWIYVCTMGMRLRSSAAILFSCALARSIRAACSGVGGVSDMIWGFFACAPKVEKMISSPRRHMLRQLILLLLDIIAPQTYLYL